MRGRKQLLRLFWCQRLDLVSDGKRRIDEHRGVANDESPAKRSVERVPQDHPHVGSASGCDAIAFERREPSLNMIRGELRDAAAAKAGHDVSTHCV